MKTCNNCSKSIDDDFLFCPHCGIKIEEPKTEPIAENEKAKTENVKWYNKTSVAAATAIIGVIAVIIISIVINIRIDTKINQENERKISLIIEELEDDGWICITDGYTFDKCAEVARTYLLHNYDEDFYDDHVVVTTKDAVIYYISGFSKTGKAIDVCIGHYSQNWYIIDASVYKKD